MGMVGPSGTSIHPRRKLTNVASAEVLKKPLHTSIAVEIDEFEDIEVEDNLHIIMNVRDFRAIIQHAGIAGHNLTAQYSTPARPVMLTYPGGEAVNCEFLLMTVGERSANPAQKTKRTRGANGPKAAPRQQLEAASRRQSAAPSEAPSLREQSQQAPPGPEEIARPSAMPPPPQPMLSARNTIHASAFDLRPSQRAPPPATMRSEGLFVDDDNFQWEPVRDDDEDDEDNARLEWDHSAQKVSLAVGGHPEYIRLVAVLTRSIGRLGSPAQSRLAWRQRGEHFYDPG